MDPRKITGEVLMVVMPVSNWMECKTTGTKNSADAVAQQPPRRNADQTKQKCLLANDAFELPGRCANGFQKSVKPDIPCNRDLKNVIDDKIPRENHQQQKSCYGDHKFRIKLRLQLG